MDRTSPGWRPQRLLDVVSAAMAAGLAFLAVPAALVLIVGDPLSNGLGHAWHPLPRDLMGALAVAAWVAWAACCAQLIRAVVRCVRSGDVRAQRSSSPVERVAARIAIGVLALTSLGAPLAVATGAGASTSPGAMMASVAARPLAPARSAPAPDSGTSLASGASPIPARPGPGATYEVAPGETLWSIADATLGDRADWTTLAALNLGRDMLDGTRFVDPDLLRAGWRLRLPADTRRDKGTGSGPHARHRQAERPATLGSQPDTHLPELLALGLGSLACAALARKSATRRRLQPFTGDELWPVPTPGPSPAPTPVPTEAAVDAAALVHRFEGVPALDLFEAANRLLGSVQEDRTDGPIVHAIRVGPTGVTFWLAQPDLDTPSGFKAMDHGAAWHVEHRALDGGSGSGPAFVAHDPYVPLALPIGDDDDGTWLVALNGGDVVPLLGASAPALWRAARGAVRAWAWSDAVLVTEDPSHPDLVSDRSAARHVLFFGDPAALPRATARSIAVVTTASVPASGVTVLVDHRGATIHPLGRVVRPYLQSAETADAIDELVAPRPHDAEPPNLASRAPAMPRSEKRTVPKRTAHGPGAIDVRLLTMTPRLDGLREELPPNRARRAVELVAYLALHEPDVITSDRLRTRVLGSSDADAAAKTLFNTTHAARRAMGVDEHGDPLFPSATRNGLYQLSPEVTVDVRRAAALVAAGLRHADDEPDVAMTHLCAALDLVEGEPLANALAGYSWWEAEGHGGRIAAVLADAACTLAGLAADAGRFALGWWGLERARLVEPYSEALARAAMRLAASEGDTDRLRLEWRDCQRMVDALDPGSSPSPRTETLYGELTRHVLVDAPEPEGPTVARTQFPGELLRRRYAPFGD